jgi:hypothetical protein
VKTRQTEAALKRKYGARKGAGNLHHFFFPSQDDKTSLVTWMRQRIQPISEEDFKCLFVQAVNFLHALPSDHLDFLQAAYPEFRLWQREPLSLYTHNAPLAMAM